MNNEYWFRAKYVYETNGVLNSCDSCGKPKAINHP